MKGYRRDGFTILELMLVALVLTIFAGAVVVNYSGILAQWQWRQTIEALEGTLRYAQSRAVIKRHQVRLVFENQGQSYWLEEQGVGSQGPDDFIRLKGQFGHKHQVAKAVNMMTPATKMYFYPQGRMDRVRVPICLLERCVTLSTKEQRGAVWRLQGQVE